MWSSFPRTGSCGEASEKHAQMWDYYPIVQIVQSQGVTGYTAFIVEKLNLPFP